MIKGLYNNTTPDKTPEGYAYYGKNGINNRYLDACLNERGTQLMLGGFSEFSISYIIGIETYGDDVIICYKRTDNHDCILVWNQKTNSKIVKLDRVDFNFNASYPLDIEPKYNFKNQLVIVITDNLNPPRYINLEDTTRPLNYYNLFPISYNPSDIAVSTLDSGNILTGAYIVFIQYITVDRTRSAWSYGSNPVYITTVDESTNYIANKGVNTGQASSKSIKIDLSSLDTTYQKVAIGILSKVNGVVSAKIIKEVDITSSTLTVIYSGTELVNDLTLGELLDVQPIYETVKHLTTVADQLYLGELTTKAENDLQHIANQTSILWVSKFEDDNLIINSKTRTGNAKTFIHEEVYAFYVQFELSNGRFTRAFHIPGPALIAGDRATAASVSDSGGLKINGHDPYVYQVDDTCTYNGVDPSGTRSGSMGKWENENESYPATFPDVGGQKVRHFKFPSIAYMDGVWGNGRYGISALDKLGIKVTNYITGSTGIYDAATYGIIGMRILFAKKDLNNVGTLGMSILQFAGNPQLPGTNQPSDPNVSSTTTGNWNLDSQQDAQDNITLDKNYLRFNAFDIWQDRPSLNNIYLRNLIFLDAVNLNNTGTANYGPVLQGGTNVDQFTYFSNFTNYNATITKVGVTAPGRIRKLSSGTYVPNNIQFAAPGGKIIDNRLGEETVWAKIEGTTIAASIVAMRVNNAAIDSPGLHEPTYLSAIRYARSDYFIAFDSQVLIPCSGIIRFDTSVLVVYKDYFSGDGFTGVYSYLATAPCRNKDLNPTRATRNFKALATVGRHNPAQRYLVQGDYSTYFWPDAGLLSNRSTTAEAQADWFFWLNSANGLAFNSWKYSKDFSTINEYEEIDIYNRSIAQSNQFLYRIQRSTLANKEGTQEDGWRTFKALDYFDAVRNRGPITNLQGWGGDILIIHHRDAIFRTRDKAVLQTTTLNVQLGAGDIFDITPKEENASKYGFGGTQHKWGCLLCELGYVYVDSVRGSVYLYTGTELVDISKGERNFFQTYLPTYLQDNPLNTGGISIAFDNLNSRLLLSLKGNLSFTLSYDTVRNEWAYFHDYKPDFIFNTRDNLYSIKSKSLYKHNYGNFGEYYGVLYPFFVDMVINNDPSEQKVLASIQWISKYILNGAIDFSKGLTHITIWNDLHSSGRITLKPNTTDSLFEDLKSNCKVKDENWSFDDITNKVKSFPFTGDISVDYGLIPASLEDAAWFDSEPIRGKYFIVRLEYSNLENAEVQLLDLSFDNRLSHS